MSWLDDSYIPYTILEKAADNITNLGEEGSTYLTFILRNYHRLPRWTLFLTAKDGHWHHALASQGMHATMIRAQDLREPLLLLTSRLRSLVGAACSTCVKMHATSDGATTRGGHGLGFLSVNHDRSGRMLLFDKPTGQPAELPRKAHAELR